MNLFAKLKEREANGHPIRVGLIGAGKFGSMFLAQARTIPGMHVMAIADLSPDRAKKALAATGWDAEASVASTFQEALASRRTMLTDDAAEMIAAPGLEVVIDATGNPAAGIRHALSAVENGRHIVMVNVEADVLAGAYLADLFRKAGLVYSMAYGDQPALVCEMVDWARTCGFSVVAAGKGTKYLPDYLQSTPDTVWGHYGISAADAERGGMNPQMFNSFIDGTKSAIEMAAIANATGLDAPDAGLAFPPAGCHDLADVLKPKAGGGQLDRAGMVEVVSSEERDGRHVVNDLRWGVYVTFEADADARGEYARRCFREYQVATDKSGRYASLFRPSHLIGLELPVSVASAALRGEPTGTSNEFRADVAAVAKRDLSAGETLDGEGGYCVRGHLMPAAKSLKAGALPIGLAHGVKLVHPVAAGAIVTWDDVEAADGEAIVIRRRMEQAARA